MEATQFRRITVDDVRQAFARIGLLPVAGTWGDGKSNCCAQVAICLDEMGKEFTPLEDSDVDVGGYRSSDDFDDWLDGSGIDRSYALAFRDGWDQWEPDASDEFDDLLQGYVNSIGRIGAPADEHTERLRQKSKLGYLDGWNAADAIIGGGS